MSGKKFLIVEDEAMIALLLEDFLDMLGHEVVATAGSVESASAAVEAGGFDAAVLDLNLGGQKVWSVARRLAANEIPFAFASGAAGDPLPQEFVGRPVIGKPFSLASVEATLRTLIDC